MKQTAIEWMAAHVNHVIDLHNKKLISEDEFRSLLIEYREQAKQMEKEQHQETFKQSRQAKIFEQDMPPVWKSFEQYYNETFKSE